MRLPPRISSTFFAFTAKIPTLPTPEREISRARIIRRRGASCCGSQRGLDVDAGPFGSAARVGGSLGEALAQRAVVSARLASPLRQRSRQPRLHFSLYMRKL